ncbi:glycosyltransferase family 41 protein [Herbaspirillum sp. HC18]|nr:glycosyltransferase family 41 protein [Herbaspirillum sp. HC18]
MRGQAPPRLLRPAHGGIAIVSPAACCALPFPNLCPSVSSSIRPRTRVLCCRKQSRDGLQRQACNATLSDDARENNMPMSTLPTAVRIALQQALHHHQRGRLKEAEQLYRMVLKTHPGQLEAGRNLLASMFVNGRYAEMELEARQIVAAAPRFGVAWKGLGLAQLMQGKDALHAFEMAAKHLQDDAESHDYLGVALKRCGRLEDAVDSFRRAIKFNPSFPGAHVNLGNALKDLGRYEAAVTNYRRALELRPDLAEAHNNLGTILRDQGRIEEALASYRRALELKPDLAEAHNNLGQAMKDLGRFGDAEACFRHALESKPDFAGAHYNLAAVLHDQGRAPEAQESCARALGLAPDNAMFRIAQVLFQLPVVPHTAAEAANAPAQFDTALNDLGAWMQSSPRQQIDASLMQLPFYLAYRKGNHASRLSRYGDLLAPPQAPVVRAEGRSRIRLALVSGHFRRHSVWDINVKGLLQQIDRSRFEIVLYHLDRPEDEETAFAKSMADIWRDARSIAGFDGWLRAFAEDRPDAVYYPELGMDPIAYSLACLRLAPVQAAGWGHPVTSGLPAIDLYFSGELLEPSDADAHYRERLVKLPGTGCCTVPLAIEPEPLPELEAELEARGGPRFLIAQSPFKIDPSDDDLFARIAETAGGNFILLSHPQFPLATEQLVARIGQAFMRRGLVPEKHLLILPWMSQTKFQALLDLCDVYLDCPTFSGYTTARMAVRRGLPLLTLEGPFMRQRLAAGLLRRIGAEDTIATTEQGYISMAALLAGENVGERHERRERLRAAAELADNDVRTVRAFEQSLVEALSS